MLGAQLEQSLEDQLQRMTVMRAETGVHVDTGPLSSRSQHYVPEDSEERLGRLPLSQRPLTLWEKGAKVGAATIPLTDAAVTCWGGQASHTESGCPIRT